MMSSTGFTLIGKNLLPLALRFKNFNLETSASCFNEEVKDKTEVQLTDMYRDLTGESEKDICELAGKEVTVDNIRILVHLTLKYAKELKAQIDEETLEELQNIADQEFEVVPSKKRKIPMTENFTKMLNDDMDDSERNVLERSMMEFLNEMNPGGKNTFKQTQTFKNATNAAKCMSKAYTEKCEQALAKSDDVKHLPVEDTIWLIEELGRHSDEEGNIMVSLMVQDNRGMVLGYSVSKQSDITLKKQCHDLITICALNPIDGTQRRPRNVTCKEPSFAEKAAGLDLSDLDIRYMYAGVTAPEKSDCVRMRECCVCGRRGSKALFKKCSSCQSMLYCSRVCQKKDWSMSGDMAVHSHKLWCKKMKLYMSKTEQLSQFPFTFTQETTSENFFVIQYKQFLERAGVYNCGFWRREARLPGVHENCQCCVSYGDISDCDDGIVLPVESTILAVPPDNEMTQTVSDWNTYYQYRGFRLDSPIAILLQWPLTMYFVIKYCLPNDYSEWWDGLDGGTLVIDVLGVEKEIEMLDLFKELEYLLPDVSIDIVMYGAEISPKVNNKIYTNGNTRIKVRQGIYHRKAEPDRKPDIVIGFNAGLAAYKGWSQTLVKLRTDKVPAYFTDYCQYSCECSKIAVQKLGVGTISDPVINPFRSPVRKLSSHNDMPWYSNGFIFHLVYP